MEIKWVHFIISERRIENGRFTGVFSFIKSIFQMKSVAAKSYQKQFILLSMKSEKYTAPISVNSNRITSFSKKSMSYEMPYRAWLAFEP